MRFFEWASLAGMVVAVCTTLPAVGQEKEGGKEGKESDLAQAEGWEKAEARRLFEYALSLHREQKLRQAIQVYRTAIERYPLLHEARVNLAGALIDSRKLDQAEALLDRLDTLLPEDERVTFNRALLLALKGEREWALELLAELMEREDASLKVYLLMGNLLRELGRTVEAQQTLMMARAAFPAEFASHYEYARCADLNGDVGEAVQAYQLALRYATADEQEMAARVRLRMRSLLDRREKPAGPSPEEPKGVKVLLE